MLVGYLINVMFFEDYYVMGTSSCSSMHVNMLGTETYVHFVFISRHRIPKNQWWLKLRPLLRILAKHESAYEEEGMYMTVEDTTVAEGVI
jgi:hypothetical protein